MATRKLTPPGLEPLTSLLPLPRGALKLLRPGQMHLHGALKPPLDGAVLRKSLPGMRKSLPGMPASRRTITPTESPPNLPVHGTERRAPSLAPSLASTPSPGSSMVRVDGGSLPG